MSANTISSGLPLFLGLTGAGLNAGRIYIGVAGEDPVANPVPLFWDEAQTIPAPQPLWTIGGYISRAGAPATVYGPATYSILVNDRFGIQIFYCASVDAGLLRADLAAPAGSSLIGYTNGGTGTATRTVESKLSDALNARDFGAVCDGVNDDTAAILAMRAYALANNGRSMTVPGPTAVMTDTFELLSFTNMLFEGDINATGLGAGKSLFHNNQAAFSTTEINGIVTGNLQTDFWRIDSGVNNRMHVNEVLSFFHGVLFVSAGGGVDVKVENRIYFNLIQGCNYGIRFTGPTVGTGGAVDACQGFEAWGGFVLNCTHGVLIEAGVDARYGYMTGAIDGGGVAGSVDYSNDSAISGWNLNLKFIRDPAFYALGRMDRLDNTQISGLTIGETESGGFPSMRVTATIPPQIATLGKASFWVTIANVVGGLRGAFIGNDATVSSSAAAGGIVGSITDAPTAAGARRWGMQSVFRNNADMAGLPGHGIFFNKAAGADTCFTEIVDGSGNRVFGAYAGDRINLPVAKTPTGSADASGLLGDIAWDAGYVYVKTPAGWKRSALATF